MHKYRYHILTWKLRFKKKQNLLSVYIEALLPYSQIPFSHHWIWHVHLNIGEDARVALHAHLVSRRAILIRAHRVKQQTGMQHDPYIGQTHIVRIGSKLIAVVPYLLLDILISDGLWLVIYRAAIICSVVYIIEYWKQSLGFCGGGVSCGCTRWLCIGSGFWWVVARIKY